MILGSKLGITDELLEQAHFETENYIKQTMSDHFGKEIMNNFGNIDSTHDKIRGATEYEKRIWVEDFYDFKNKVKKVKGLLKQCGLAPEDAKRIVDVITASSE